jgi:myosin heavy subunit
VPDADWIWLAAEVVSEDLASGAVEACITDEAFYSHQRKTQQHPQQEKLVKFTLQDTGLKALPLQNSDDNENLDGVSDMCALSYLHEAAILENLRR